MTTTLPDVGKTGHDHPATSHAAARRANVTGQRARVLDCLLKVGPYGLTARAIAMRLNLSPNQTATRLMELREADEVVRLHQTRDTGTGSKGHVHVHGDYRPSDVSLIMPEPGRHDPVAAAHAALGSGWNADHILRVLDEHGLTFAWKRGR